MKTRLIWHLLACLSPIFLLGAAVAATPESQLEGGVLLQAQKILQERTVDDPEKRGPTRSPAARAVYRKTVDAVVLVITRDGLGSGAIFHPDGWVVTNWHVVGENPVVGVIFRQDRLLSGAKITEQDLYPAYVKHRDPTRDLALLLLARRPPALIVVPIASMTQLQVGEEVFAIGHPKGYLWTYTQGIISQIRPNYRWQTDRGIHKATVIQTQTVIAPGSSGGPLFDSNGSLAGIVAAGNPDAPGLNFAIAANELTDFVRELVSKARR